MQNDDIYNKWISFADEYKNILFADNKEEWYDKLGQAE